MKYLALIVLFATLVAGCASTGGYIQSESPDASIVKSSSHRDDWSTWESYRVMAVDDKFISGPLSATADTAERIAPGTRSLVIGIQFNRGFGTGPFDAMAPLTVTLKPGASYARAALSPCCGCNFRCSLF